MNILQGPFAWYGILIAMLIVLCIIVALIVKCVRQQAKHVDNRLAAGVIAPTVMFRQNSRSGGESAEARVLPPRTLAHVNSESYLFYFLHDVMLLTHHHHHHHHSQVWFLFNFIE